MADLITPNPQLQEAIAKLYLLDPDFSQIEAVAGKLEIRSYPPTFASLVRIIIGQQLSTKAADAIFLRLTALVEISPASLVVMSETELRTVGLSRAKIVCCQTLAIAILEEKFSIESLDRLSDRAIASQTTSNQRYWQMDCGDLLVILSRKTGYFACWGFSNSGCLSAIKELTTATHC